MRSPGPLGLPSIGPRARPAWRMGILAALLMLTAADPARADDTITLPDLAERLRESWRWRALPPTPADGVLRTIRSGGDGEHLFASDGNDLHQFDGYAWTTIPNGSEGYWSIRDVTPIDGGWLLGTSSSLGTWHDDRGETELVGHDAGIRFSRPAHDADGRLLVGLDEHLFEVVDGELEPRLAAPTEGGMLWDLVTGPDGDILALMEQGLFRLGPRGWSRQDTDHAWPRSRPEVVVATDGLVYILSRWFGREQPGLVWDGRRLSPLPPPPVEGVEIIEDATVRPDGTLLLASRHARLLMLRDGHWTMAPPAPPVDREYIASVCFVGERLVVLTASGLVYACDLASERWQVHSLPGGVADRTIVNALSRDAQGRLWATTEEGIGLWGGEDWVEFHHTAGPGGHELAGITTICVDDRGHVWVASGSAFSGAFEYDGATWTHHDRKSGLETMHVHRIVKGPDGALWFGLLASSPDDVSTGGGLGRFHEGEWTLYTADDGLPHDRCYDVGFTPDGRVWAATAEGLGRFDGRRWSRVEEPGLPVKLLFTLFVDSEGQVYIGRGLQIAGVWRRNTDGTWHRLAAHGRTRPSAAHFAEDTRGRVHFASDSGLFRVEGDMALELTAPEAAPVANFWPLVSDGEGGLWLGSRGDGLVHYRPDDHEPPRILDFQPWASPTDGRVSTTWTGADKWNRTPVERLRAETRVDGGPWSPEPDTRSLTLLPGPHTVGLRLIDAAGNDSAAVSVPVEVPDVRAVRQALTVSGAFLLMALAVVAGSVWLRARERRVEQQRLKELTLRLITSQEDERRKLSRDLHDDLGQILTAATLDLQVAERAPDEAGRGAARRRALDTVRMALERARKFSSVLRPRMLDELGLAQALSAALSEFQERTGLTVLEHVDLGPERLPEPLAGHVYRMVQEALTNVARHARASRVEVRAELKNGRLELEIEDDGVGFAVQDQRHTGGQGLDILAERAAQVGGRLEVDSQPGKGTRIRLFAPSPFAR